MGSVRWRGGRISAYNYVGKRRSQKNGGEKGGILEKFSGKTDICFSMFCFNVT